MIKKIICKFAVDLVTKAEINVYILKYFIDNV